MAFSLGEYQDIFLEEADEQIEELNQNLLELEKNPDNFETVNSIFRVAHTLKGASAFVGLNDLSDLAHKMENLLQGIRDKTLALSTEIIDLIFKCFDVIKDIIETIAAGEEPKHDLSGLINELQQISESGSEEPAPSDDNSQSEAPESNIPATTLQGEDVKKIAEGLNGGKNCSEITIFIEESAQMKWIKAQLVLNNLQRIGDVVKTIPSEEDLADDSMNNIIKVILLTEKHIEEVKKACDIDLIFRIDIKNITLSKKNDKTVVKFGSSDTFMNSEDVAAQIELQSSGQASSDDEQPDLHDDEESADKTQKKKSAEPDRKKTMTLKSVKVSVDKLDELLNNVAELVIANSGFYKLYEEIRGLGEAKIIVNEFKNRMEQMSRIAKDLQAGIMKTRMVEIGQVFNRFNRLVRDLAKELDKNVELVVRGEDTELDKKVIDSIGEPLMHLIRNAIDHGIESPEERKKIGKSEQAHVTLNAYQGGNQIFVEVSDDGRGLDVDKIKKKVVEKDMATPEMLANMDDQDIFNFIFRPGYSTAEEITDVSGRGVGMNIVKEIVSELNGNVIIETEIGMGTRFVLSFPITLAIIPAIMTKVKNEMYAIPLSDVIETVKIAPSDITTVEGNEVINFRGEILSLVRLSTFVGLKSAFKHDDTIPVVEVGFGNRKIGLIVDSLEGKQEIVIKSIEQNYKVVDGLAGASILGDGSICLILDISSMINKVITDKDRFMNIDNKSIRDVTESRRMYDEDEVEDFDDTQADDESAALNMPAERPGLLTPLHDKVETDSKSDLRAEIERKKAYLSEIKSQVDFTSETSDSEMQPPLESKSKLVSERDSIFSQKTSDADSLSEGTPVEDAAVEDSEKSEDTESVAGPVDRSDEDPQSQPAEETEKSEDSEEPVVADTIATEEKAGDAGADEAASEIPEPDDSKPADTPVSDDELIDLHEPDVVFVTDTREEEPAEIQVENLVVDDDEKSEEKTPVETMPVQKAFEETVTEKESPDPEENAGDDVRQEVQERLTDFKQELRDNIEAAISSGSMEGEPSKSALNVAKEDLQEFQLLANMGAANAAESLSKILSKRIDLSIPEVSVKPTEKIPEYIGDIDSTYIGVMLPIEGDIKGTVLFILDENVGFELIDLLYSLSSKDTKELDENGESALKEVTNILGSSVVNIFSEKTNMLIKPGVPTIVHDYMQSIIDSILIMHNMKNDYAIIMDTAFYFEDDKVIGNFLLLPEAESLKKMVEDLRVNVKRD